MSETVTATVEPIMAAEKIFRGMKNPPRINVTDSDAAYYRPGTDEITLPNMGQFVNAESFYSTAFHEMAHSTGHKTRLDRGLDGSFGSDPYSREELVAEMTAAFLAAEAGILDKVQDNNTAYVQHWAARLGKEPRLILDAASAAQKAADYILGVTWDKASESSEED
jgi:antirestriction protein ArdC